MARRRLCLDGNAASLSEQQSRRNSKDDTIEEEPTENNIEEDSEAPEETSEIVQEIFWRTETTLSEDNDDESDQRSVDESLCSSTTTEVPTTVTAEQLENESPQKELLVKQQTYTVVRDEKKGSVFVQVDVEKYMAKRQMTPLQERMNALTMIPPPLFCICYILSGNWVSQALIGEAQKDLAMTDFTMTDHQTYCLDWSTSPFSWLFRNFHALPPLPVLAYTIGVTIHAPFSFLYHWNYAHALSPGKRTIHWSRRMDQSMLHVSSALTSFATGGSWNFFLINAAFNADSIYRQFQQEVKPHRNQRRLGIAIVAWTLPILVRGDIEMFFRVLSILALGIFLFVKYPVGGWSHSAFHLVMLPLIPLLTEVAISLPCSQEGLKVAAQCYAMS